MLTRIADELASRVDDLGFGPPVAHVYNPLIYACAAHHAYLNLAGAGSGRVVLLGMNPGPWGMTQTGVPFGEVAYVREWLGIDAPVEPPAVQHPKRPILGFDCRRSEVSGRRVWGWAKQRFEHPEAFFELFLIWNYCPLAFLLESGANLTPDRLLGDLGVPVGRMLHPSPASPAANRGWQEQAERDLRALGVEFQD